MFIIGRLLFYGVFFACHGRKQGYHSIKIEDRAYVEMNAIIIARKDEGTIIGENAVVGACTLVNKSIPEGATSMGVPAKVIG
ncbi:acyltransferase [Bacteroides faecalis]|uniref:Acetyltransferase n=1 Tax=Bacteroides faecalis TaxID=2447885 RepID=A0A401LRV8_9BACE|nr:hypothetical protein [Bacteroides faecalis]GCB34310.1 hypothetical protein KGMB02408_12550 [Bacteroides faecalis]